MQTYASIAVAAVSNLRFTFGVGTVTAHDGAGAAFPAEYLVSTS